MTSTHFLLSLDLAPSVYSLVSLTDITDGSPQPLGQIYHLSCTRLFFTDSLQTVLNPSHCSRTFTYNSSSLGHKGKVPKVPRAPLFMPMAASSDDLHDSLGGVVFSHCSVRDASPGITAIEPEEPSQEAPHTLSIFYFILMPGISGEALPNCKECWEV